MRKWLGGWISTYWRSLSVVFIVLLLNYFIVTRVVGLAYSSFSWSAFAQAYDPYDDDDDDDDDPAEPYGELTPAPSQEPSLPLPTVNLPTSTPLATAKPLATPTLAGTAPVELYADLNLPGAAASGVVTITSPITPTTGAEPSSPGFVRGPGFLGTGASMGADIALLGEAALYMLLLLGVAVQLMRLWKAHDWIMTIVVIGNFFLILFLMIGSYRALLGFMVSGNASLSPDLLLPLVHGGLGTLAEIVAIYCLLAGHKILPRKIGTLRYFMWLTFVLWTMAFALGTGTYFVYYLTGGEEAPDGEVVDVTATPFAIEDLPPDLPPPPQRILLQNFVFSPATVTVLAGTNVTWFSQDRALHNVTFADGSVTSDDFRQAGSFAFTFTEPGEYVIYCSLHGGPGNGMSSTVTVVERTEATVAQVLAQPTPDTVPPTPTPAPSVPPPPVALIEPPTPDVQVVGLVAFYDQFQASDSVMVTLNGMAAPPPGFVYVGWLINSLTGQVWNVGTLTVDGSGAVTHSTTHPLGENLMAQYDGFEITLEQGEGNVQIPGTVVYSGSQPRQATEIIRRMTVAAATPRGLGYAVGARYQVEELIRHVEFVEVALELLSITDAQRHSEHILNILVGELAAQDIDGRHGIQNPGDTFGIDTYLENLKATALAAGSSADATNAIRIHSTHVGMAADNALAWSAELQQAVQNIAAATSVSQIAEDVATLRRVSTLLLWGADADGDGTVEPEEGGIFTAYQHAQYTGAIGVTTGAAAAIVDPEPVADAVIVATNSGELVVEMRDFSNEPPRISIIAGTVVRFVNVGQALHSATADDGHFDTGLIGNSQSQAFTFDAPGTYSYYCTLHGLPGGVGMAGTIEVTAP